MKIPKVQKRKTRRSNRNAINAILTQIKSGTLPVDQELSVYEPEEIICDECEGTGIPYSFRYYCTGPEVCTACLGIGTIYLEP